MGKRRMFSLDIIDQDKFLDLPATTQLLYFHLLGRTDDEGFVGNPKRTARMINSTDMDFKLLIDSGFIIPFKSDVIVITHFCMQNTIKNDRFKPTIYNEERQLLRKNSKKEYVLIDNWGFLMDEQLKKKLNKEYYEKHKEERKAYFREYYLKNKKRKKAYNRKNRKKQLKYFKDYYTKHKEKRKIQNKEYYLNHKDYFREYLRKYMKVYYQKNRDVLLERIYTKRYENAPIVYSAMCYKSKNNLF